MSDVLVREAREEDCEEIADLSGQLGKEMTVIEAKDRIEKISREKDQKIFVATLEDKVVGLVYVTCHLELLSGNQARIEGLVVDETIRGKGLGRKLMEQAEDWAKKMGSKTMKVNSNTKRVESHKFYERIGYIKTKEQAIFKKEL